MGQFSQARLKLSFLIDHVFTRPGVVDLNAYFRKPIQRVGKKWIQLDHPFLNRTEVTGNKSLYIAGLALRKIGAKQSIFTRDFWRSFEETLERSAAQTIRDRWRNLFSSVRRSYRNTVAEASRDFHSGNITEEDYLNIVSQAFDRKKRLIALLSAGGLGRLSEQGLHKLDDMIKSKRKEFLETAKENIDRYNKVIQEERDARKEERRVKDRLSKQAKAKEKATIS